MQDWVPRVYASEDGAKLGSYSMAPLFEPTNRLLKRVGELEEFGRVLAEYLSETRETYLILEELPDDVKKAMVLFCPQGV